MEKIFSAIIFFIIAINLSAREGLFIKNIDKEQYPIIKADIYNFKTDEILPTKALNTSDFEIIENNNPVSIIDIENHQRNFKNSIELIIYFDMAISNSNQSLAQSILDTILSNLDYSLIKTKIIGFDKINVLYNDFTSDQSQLQNSSTYFDYSKFSNLDVISYFEKFNIETSFSAAAENKSILLITDNNKSFDHQKLEFEINNANIDFNTIYLNEIENESLKYLENTNSNYFQQNILDSISANLNIQIILSNILGYKHSTLSWNSLIDCENTHSTTVNYIYEENNSSSFNYQVHDSLKPYLEIKPDSLKFSNIIDNNTTKDIFITAKNGDITLNDIFLEDDFDGVFQLTGGLSGANEYLNEGDQYPLRLKFSPIDSSIVFTRLRVNSTSCKINEFEVIGGFPNVPPKNKTLELSYPDCDDVLIIGEKTNVQWTGVMPDDVIQLEYTLNNGKTWDTLAKNRINLEYLWNTPNIETDSAMVRVIQLWPNNVGKTLSFPHSAGLNHAVFSHDGSLIATGGNDSIISIWNSNTGQKLKEFKGHEGDIRTIEFSKDNKFILSTSNSTLNKYAIIWDIEAENQEDFINFKFDDHKDFLFSAYYNPINSHVITASRDGTYNIWDVQNKSIIKKSSNNGDRYFYARYSPKGTYYIAGRFIQGTCEFYDANNHSLKYSIDVKQERLNGVYPRYLEMSPDETEFLLIDNIHTAECTVWDLETGDLKFKLKHYDENQDSSQILHASYFWKDDKKYILTSGVDNRIIQWDGTTGDTIVSFVGEHSNAITSAYYNFDGSRIVSASSDLTAKVWNLDERDLQMDSSDCVFRIVKVALESRNISLGEELVGERKDTVFNDYLINKSSIPYQIKSFEIIGAERSNFKILNPNSFILDTNKNIDLNIAFIPSKVGLIQAQIKIIIPADTLLFNISGIGLENELKLNKNIIDFGEIDNEDLIEIMEENILTNNSSDPITFDSIYISYPEISNFNIANLQDIATLNQNSNLDINLLFNPNEEKEYAAVLNFRHNLKNQIEKILLLGIGVKPLIDSIDISLSDIQANIGETHEVILSYNKISNQSLNPLSANFKLILEYNNTILEPLFDFQNLTVFEDKSQLELNIKINDLNLENGILKKLPFKIALGNEESTKIDIFDIQPNSKININYSGANVDILNHCYEGGIRLFQSDGRFRLEQNTPNPAQNSTHLEYEILENGKSKLYILNELGKTVKTVFDYYAEPGSYSIEIDLNDLSPGIYYYILETPNNRKLKKLIVT